MHGRGKTRIRTRLQKSNAKFEEAMTEHNATMSMFDPALLRPAIADSFRKLTPRTQFRNPVMFCVYVGSILTTILWLAALGGQAEAPAGFILAVTLWLWFTVLFAHFAEA